MKHIYLMKLLLLSNGNGFVIDKTTKINYHPNMFSKYFTLKQFANKNLPLLTSSRNTRVFGSKSGVLTNPSGSILIHNNQKHLPYISILSLRHTISVIRRILSYPTYDIALYLVDDDRMRETNLDSRGIDKPTDILAFPFDNTFIKPGVLQEPDFDIGEYYCLGELMVNVPYVIKQCKEDREIHERSIPTDNAKIIGYNIFERVEDRGVSMALRKVYDPNERIHMLLVHGMLHLVGYDHESNTDYKIMVAKEEDILKKWKDIRKDIY